MRLNLRHWFLMLLVVELVMGFMLKPVLLSPDPVTRAIPMMLMMVVFPCFISFTMIMLDLSAKEQEQKQNKREAIKAEKIKVARKVDTFDDGTKYVYLDEHTEIYPDKDSLVPIRIHNDNIKHWARTIAKLEEKELCAKQS